MTCKRLRLGLSLSLALFFGLSVSADPAMFERFDAQPETRWAFFSDTVMGGVSTGEAAFVTEGDTAFVRMTGQVSTANRGGFIQVRRMLDQPVPEGTTGVRLRVRGNSQRYFIHLRTTGTVLPWQYYQADFEVSDRWAEVRLDLSAFKASGAMLRQTPLPGTLTSLGIVAYGRDHQARIDVSEISFY